MRRHTIFRTLSIGLALPRSRSSGRTQPRVDNPAQLWRRTPPHRQARRGPSIRDDGEKGDIPHTSDLAIGPDGSLTWIFQKEVGFIVTDPTAGSHSVLKSG